MCSINYITTFLFLAFLFKLFAMLRILIQHSILQVNQINLYKTSYTFLSREIWNVEHLVTCCDYITPAECSLVAEPASGRRQTTILASAPSFHSVSGSSRIDWYTDIWRQLSRFMLKLLFVHNLVYLSIGIISLYNALPPSSYLVRVRLLHIKFVCF